MRTLIALGVAALCAAPSLGQDAENRAGQAEAGVPRATQQASDEQQQSDGQTTGTSQQGQGATGQGATTGSPTQGNAQRAANLDQQIAACLLLGNQSEVALAEFAKDRCKNDECKQFADMMIEQHRQAISKIEEAAPQVAAMKLALRNAPGKGQGEDGNDQNSQNGQPSQATAQGGGLSPAMMLARQVKEECLAMTTKALGEKEEGEFDECYIQQQVMAHMGMIAELKGSEPFASAQLKPVLKEGMQMAQKHLEEAKGLMKQMKDKSEADSRQANTGN